MNLLKMIAAYDADRESYIRELEDKVLHLERQLSERTDLLMSGERLREGLMLKLIVSGAFDDDKVAAMRAAALSEEVG